jgi:hypothetical protein
MNLRSSKTRDGLKGFLGENDGGSISLDRRMILRIIAGG